MAVQSLSSKVYEMLDFEDYDIKKRWRSWDKSDCSDMGIVELLLYQKST